MLHAVRGGRRWLFGFGGEPLGFIFELRNQLGRDVWHLQLKLVSSIRIGNKVRRDLLEPFLEDAEQVIGGCFELIFAKVPVDHAAAIYMPNDALRLGLGRFDLLFDDVAGSAELIE